MTKRKFTPPTKFPAEYVDSNGGKAVVLGVSPNCEYPFIGYDRDGDCGSWTLKGEFNKHTFSTPYDLHDIPKRITTWHNVYATWLSTQCRTRRKADDLADDRIRLCVYRIERDEDGGNPEIFVEDV